MKIKIMLHAMTFAAVLASCQTNGESSQKSGIDLANLDSTYLPGTDFYMFAKMIRRELIEGVAAQQNEKGSVAQKIADLYNSAMDSVALNEHGLDEMAAFLACDGYQTSAQITQDWLKQVWPKMLRQGVDGLMGFYIGADEKDSKNNILSIVQGGLTLGQKDYYLDQDPETAKIREAYVAYIRQLVSHVGFGEPMQ